jgi:hypothetical protein
MNDAVVAEWECGTDKYHVVCSGETYDVYLNDKCIQPNHDAAGIIRYLAFMLHNTSYLLRRKM